jgi:glycosyltransferase 2 family protein
MLKWSVRAAVSCAVVLVLLAFVPIETVIDALRRTRPLVWIASLAVFLSGHYVNVLKLRLLLGSPAAPLGLCMRAHYAGQAANLGLPGVAGGDFVRAAYLTPVLGPARVALASVLDRLIDTAAVLALVAIALPLAGVPPALDTVVRESAWWLAAIGSAVVLSGLAIVWLRPHEGLARKTDRAIAAIRQRQTRILIAAMMSLGVQSTFVLVNMWMAREAGVTTGPAAWFVAWPLSKLVAVLPISLGGLGVREAVLVTLLVPYGAPGEAVLASGILWQAVLAVSGVLGLIVTQTLKRQAERATTTAQRQI